MRGLISTIAALVALVLPAWAQRIEVQKPDPNRIVRVETALNHLTVIEVREPVITVAAGSPAFKIEWRENKVFIQPTEADVATNLFIWTASGRLSYELEPAGAVDQMHFAIDQPAPPPAPAPPIAANPPSLAATGVGAAEVLLNSRPIRTDGLKTPKNRVVVLLKDTFQGEANELFIRYEVRNGTRETYTISTPQVVAMNVDGTSHTLDRLSNSQLTVSAAARIKASDERPVDVISGKLRSVRVDPGQETVGVVSVKLPPRKTAPTVLRLIFPRDAKGQPTATVVL
ncbi:MAG: hypothetical protein ABSC21_23130 [Terriglobia bacterium]